MSDPTYWLAMFLGASVELALDPIDIAVGLLLGLLISKWWHGIVAAMLIGAIITVAVRVSSDFPGMLPVGWIIAGRTAAILAWSLPMVLVRWTFNRARRLQSSSGSD